MSLIQEIHSQRPVVRYALFGFSVVTTLSVIGFFWFSSVQKQMFMAIHTDPQEQQDFLARREAQTPHPLAAISRGLGSLTANIGNLLGFDGSKGFDSRTTTDHTDAVRLLPLSP